MTESSVDRAREWVVGTSRGARRRRLGRRTVARCPGGITPTADPILRRGALALRHARVTMHRGDRIRSRARLGPAPATLPAWPSPTAKPPSRTVCASPPRSIPTPTPPPPASSSRPARVTNVTPEMGVSHFLEHMMFKGHGEAQRCRRRSRLRFAIGVQHNAFTTTELTAFYAHGLPEFLEPSSEVLADILRPAIRQEDFDDEKKVIIEEIAMYRDQPIWVLYERAMEVFYQRASAQSPRARHRRHRRRHAARRDARVLPESRYSADNTILALAGRLDFERMVEAAHAAAADTGSAPNTERVFPDDHSRAPIDSTVELPTINRHYVMMISPAPSLTDPRRYAAMMLTQILGDHDGSRLYWAMVETGLADEAVAQYEGHDGCGDYIVYCSCSPDDAERAEAAIISGTQRTRGFAHRRRSPARAEQGRDVGHAPGRTAGRTHAPTRSAAHVPRRVPLPRRRTRADQRRHARRSSCARGETYPITDMVVGTMHGTSD